jgi:hypothetical protein
MKTTFLFPNRFKWIGWLLFIPSLIASLLISLFSIYTDNIWVIKVFAFANDGIIDKNQYFKIIENSIFDEFLLICLIIGGILIGFSKLKIEDEYTSKIRYESLIWATYLNYGLIIFFTLFVFGLSYFHVLLYNTFTLLLFFIIRFHFMIFKLNNTINDDE